MKARSVVSVLALLTQVACDTPNPEAEVTGEGEAGDLIAALIDRDRAYAQTADAEGIAAATRAFVARDGVLFRPDPVQASVWLSEEHPEPTNLQWVPTAAALASSGDLGYTTGPYIATDEDGQEIHGTYLSIWRMGQTGYRMELDVGTTGPNAGSLPEAADGAAAFEVVGMIPGAEPDPVADSVALESLKETDRGYAVAQATNGTSAALAAHAANGVRIHRVGRLPIVGSGEEAAADLADERPSTSPLEGRVSSSGTLGYVYGSVAQGGQGDAGNYVRIWRRDPGAAWSLALEVVSARPE